MDEVWVLIPLVAICGNYYYKIKRINAASRQGVIDDQATAEMRDLLRRLEIRVANLERAVTTHETERKYAL